MTHRLLVLLCLLLCFPSVHAAQSALAEKQESKPELNTPVSESQDTGQSPTPEVTEPATRTGAPTDQKPRREADIFQPSEEISEDFAVSFPVDI